MEIIIGREEGARRLHCIADGREFNVGQAGCVPASVSRKHCKIIINGNTMSIENLKPQNVTFVDGNQVFNKTITATSKIQLGNEKVSIPLQQILQLATGRPVTGGTQNPQQPQASTFSLRPLKKVWEEYEKQMIQIDVDAAEKKKSEKRKSRLQGLCSSVGMLFVLIPDLGFIRYVLLGISVLMTLYFLFKEDDDDLSIIKKNKLKEDLANEYKCPNPACGKPFGTTPYRRIEFTNKCLACGCKYTH